VKRAEKICKRNTSRGHRAAQKRRLKRARRAAEKTDPENAGTRIRDFTRGWTE
jgi:hypothetical protein